MPNKHKIESIQHLFSEPLSIENNFATLSRKSEELNQQQTNLVFGEKWKKTNSTDNMEAIEKFQKRWYLELYGFDSEADLAIFLQKQNIILDAGCGLGYKSSWFAQLAPKSTVIGMDFSEAAQIAANKYQSIDNLYFIQGDIADTKMKPAVDYVSCDQVIMHTEDPAKTFTHLSQLLTEDGEFACYVYRKKALPRELLDSYFREKTHDFTSDQLWDFSRQMTQLGRILSELNITIEVPEIPLLSIKGGEYDLQRFIYWNFIKCFWNPEHGIDTSDSTNFDWYGPSNAKTFSKEEFLHMAITNQLELIHFHEEEACYSGRFAR